MAAEAAFDSRLRGGRDCDQPVHAGPHLSDLHTFEVFAEVGVVLLMFSIGVEFSVPDLMRVKWIALGGGTLGILLSIGLSAGDSETFWMEHDSRLRGGVHDIGGKHDGAGAIAGGPPCDGHDLWARDDRHHAGGRCGRGFHDDYYSDFQRARGRPVRDGRRGH